MANEVKEKKEINFPDIIAPKSVRPGHSSQLTRDYFDSLLISMQFIDSDLASTKATLFGEEFDSPICITSLSHLKAFGYSSTGMEELGKAAKMNNIIDFCGHGSYEELKNITATGAKVIRIVKPFEDFDKIVETVKVAEEAGCFAIGMDIDHIYNFVGGFDNVDKIPLTKKSTEDLKRIKGLTKLPFIVKGVMSVQDTEKCLEAGVDAIFVSHHHGLFDFMSPPNMMLPEIARTVNGRVPIIYDGNVESGYDAFKALALGADFVAVGRPLIQIVANDGAEGVSKWMTKQTQQLAGIMSRSCCTKVSDIDITHIVKKEHRF